MPLVLHTARLRLRPFEPADAAFVKALNDDPRVTRYTGDGAVDLAAAAAVITYIRTRQHPFGMARLVCELDGEPVGWCGLRRLTPDELPDLGYRFFHRAWGQGLATEAARAVLSAGFARDDVPTVRAEADARNLGSIRVMQKLGMTLHRSWTDDQGPAVEYRLSRADWQAGPG
ncbi:MAG: GNAT family N-acetyltransferase [Alphaproteobacteria bacterium]|nr:GNAT family N-acetyltransferase [Alphaproteobacteria bacterium]